MIFLMTQPCSEMISLFSLKRKAQDLIDHVSDDHFGDIRALICTISIKDVTIYYKI